MATSKRQPGRGPATRSQQTPRRRSRGARFVSWVRDATLGQWLKRALVTAVAGTALVVGLFALAYSAVSLPDEPPRVQTTTVLDASGRELAELYKDENRVDVALDEVAEEMRAAVVATEDRNFYEHAGLDPIGIARAVFNDVRRRRLQGGSTITQQLVKNAYLTPERTVVRKAKEAILAIKVERQYSKDEILERYLNTVYFGRGAYGVEKAAQLYFATSAAELTLPQAALLAGLIRAPETADPERAPETAMGRRSIVLDAMVRTKAITRAEADAAEAAPLGAVARRDPNASLEGSTAYFVATVRQWAVRQFGERLAFAGGLRIETTLDADMQADADEAVRSILDRPDDPDAALVAMADDGAVVAMIGGRDFQESAVNLAMNNRRPQAGSTFKPFVLAAALEGDIPVGRRYPGPAKRRVEFDGYPPYDVSNYDQQSFGNLDLIDATARSVNTVYAQLAADVGLRSVADVAGELGIRSDLPVVPAMSLGSANVSPYEMIGAYMTFANRGERIEPYFVRKVTDAKGRLLYEAAPGRTRVLDERHADVVNHVLGQAIARGTGQAAAFGKQAAGKTGTTSKNTDAWFVGYTPRIGAAVWMGYRQDTSRKMDDVHGRAVTGGTFPAQIWQRFMRAATQGMDTGAFEPPDPALLSGEGGVPAPATSSTASTTTSTTDGTTSSTTSTTAPETTTTTTRPSGRPTTTTSPTTAPPTTTTTTPTSTTEAPP